MAARTRERRKRIALVAVCLIVVLIVVFAVLFVHYFYPRRGEEQVKVVIEKGDTAAQIASKLRDSKVITSATIFRFLSWLQGRQEDFKPGSYQLYTGMHYGEVFSILEAGSNYQVRVTIPEGLTVEQTAARLSQAMDFSQEDFIAAATSGDYGVPMVPPESQDNLEGFLFPKTYDLQADAKAADVVKVLLGQFDAETGNLDWARAGELGITPYQVVIAASLIEREAVLEEERSLVAAVIFNRLRVDMPLQIDATVQYALPEWKETLTYEDLETPSPYNTYLHKGLPPAPICSPGLASIQAVLNPAQVDYLYFVATGDGGHFFTSDYNEFLRVKEEVQR
jgi:UPF0755 protein